MRFLLHWKQVKRRVDTAEAIRGRNESSVAAVMIAASILVGEWSAEGEGSARRFVTPEVLEIDLSFYSFAWVLKSLNEYEKADKYFRKSLAKELH